ncbi:MAG: DUF1778 domain-containing protein [Planctomycetaceae bacterium]|nr:DUF1778 domain-containing protein [Planctomycetaceae bacterium]
MAALKNETRISVRMQKDIKAIIEDAATALGQTVSDFTTSCLVREARQVLHEARTTQLSNRDRDLFLAAIDENNIEPNETLISAAERYKSFMK